jgi:hypothetical protein
MRMVDRMWWVPLPGAAIVLWYENSSDPGHEPWKRYVIDLVASPAHVFAVDLDKDGDTGVVAAIGAFNYDDPASAHVVRYENAGHRGSEPRWVKHLIGQSFLRRLTSRLRTCTAMGIWM